VDLMSVIRPIIGDQVMALVFPQFPRRRVFIEAGAVDDPVVEDPLAVVDLPENYGIVSSGCETVRLAYSITIPLPFLRSSSIAAGLAMRAECFRWRSPSDPACGRGVRDKNVEPFEAVSEPRPVGSVTTSAAGSAFVVALPAGRGSV
jgi:hypothetical protein